jgi:aminoglycoside phosphotransferase (APT) family kinase protein
VESRFVRVSGERRDLPKMTTDPRIRLAEWAATRLGIESVELHEISGGASNAGFQVFDSENRSLPVAFLRASLDGVTGQGYTLQREGAILAAAAKLGFPVARVLGTRDDPDSLLMGFVEGESRPDPAEVERVAAQYMALIAALHASDATQFPVDSHDTMAAAVQADLGSWLADAQQNRSIDDPLIALAARVLEIRAPSWAGPPALVHGDVGAGNFLTSNGEVTAMLDWELAHLGDPHEDPAWLWMRGAHTSFGNPLDRFAEYEAAAGVAIDHDRLAWHVTFVMWKSMTALRGRLNRAVPGELAMIPLVVGLAYDVLLGAQLVKLIGGATIPPIGEPDCQQSTESNLSEELLHVADLERDQRVVLEFLRDSAAQAEWVQCKLAEDCSHVLGIEPDNLLAYINTCPPERLLDTAIVLTRAAERQAQASPRSIRRIERAHKIGLGRTASP